MYNILYMTLDKKIYIVYNKSVITNFVKTMVNNTIVSDIKNHADNERSGYSNWYCGITADPDKRLFNDHNVPKGEGKAWWIKRNAGSEQSARDTENCLLGLGFDGDSGGGDYSTIYVYAYKKIPDVTQE